MSAPQNIPAFPVSEVRDAYGQGLVEGSAGMTLRDWFAGQALAGLMAHPQCGPVGKRSEHDRQRTAIAAEEAYALADAMLAARQSGDAA